MPMNPRLLVPRATFDPDAAAYLRAVEAADGQALETPVKRAVDDFFKGHKGGRDVLGVEGSCILCGARTLAGALVPLVGTAPTNVADGFVSGDYTRGGSVFVRSRGAASTNGVFSSTGFIGHSRAEASVYISRNNSINVTHSSASIAADAQNIFVFARNQSGSVNSIINGRLSFYSIGESLDLAFLDARVTALVTAIGAAV
jgi:hypothetical protein